jgi:hypothetical protein
MVSNLDLFCLLSEVPDNLMVAMFLIELLAHRELNYQF